MFSGFYGNKAGMTQHENERHSPELHELIIDCDLLAFVDRSLGEEADADLTKHVPLQSTEGDYVHKVGINSKNMAQLTHVEQAWNLPKKS